jgi:hypothetical protein
MIEKMRFHEVPFGEAARVQVRFRTNTKLSNAYEEWKNEVHSQRLAVLDESFVAAFDG